MKIGWAAFALALATSTPLLSEGSQCSNLSLLPSESSPIWTAPALGSTNSLGEIHLTKIRSPAGEDYSSRLTLKPGGASLKVTKISCTGRDMATVQFESGTIHFDVTLASSPQNSKTAVVDISANSPEISNLTVEGRPGDIQSEQINVPYDTDQITYLPNARAFVNIYLDYQKSNATRFATNRASFYDPLTNGLRLDLHESLNIRVSTDFADVLPDIANPPSPFKAELSGRTVLNIWDYGFKGIADNLDKLKKSGLSHCVGIIHNWQRSGYDNALPAHLPANSAMGGDAALKAAVNAGISAGCLMALHENYVDYYPNYEYFTPSAVALDSSSKMQSAWLNPGTKIQSFGAKPSLYVSNATGQSPEIQRRYGTNASYIDVIGSVFPWWRVDMDAKAPGSGMFSTFVKSGRDLFQLEREIHKGPVFSEGNRHQFWAGLVDGVEAQFGAAKVPAASSNYPLFVDFDLLKIHPLVVNQGMGALDRWLYKGQQPNDSDLIDIYRMQEIIFGHSPFVSTELWTSVPRVMTEQNLAGPVASRYGTQLVRSIQYRVNGEWKATADAIRSRDWSIPLVEYANGDRVVANDTTADFNWEGIQIPSHGWAAQGTGLLAYTAIKDSQIVDYSETAKSVFANARNQRDLLADQSLAEPGVKAFKQIGANTATLQIAWFALNEEKSGDKKIFVHFVPENALPSGNPAFQSDRFPTSPTGNWTAGQTYFDTLQFSTPSNTADGRYRVLIGLYSPASGQRSKLLAKDAGERRYAIGTLTATNHGSQLTFTPIDQSSLADPRLNFTGRAINFGAVKTDGMVSLNREGDSWVAHVFPINREVTVFLNLDHFPAPGSIHCIGTHMIPDQNPSTVDGYWQLRAEGADSCTWVSTPDTHR